MPFTPAVKTAQVQCIYTQDNERVENVFWVQGNVDWTSVTLRGLADAVALWIVDYCLPAMVTNVKALEVIATDWSTQNGLQVISQSGLPADGSHTGSALPNNVTVAIKHATAKRGRSFRGRTYWIGLPQPYTSDNQITDGAVAVMVGVMTALANTVNTVNNGQLSVVSFTTNKTPNNPAVVTPITFFSVDINLDSQRRRLPGHNRHR